MSRQHSLICKQCGFGTSSFPFICACGIRYEGVDDVGRVAVPSHNRLPVRAPIKGMPCTYRGKAIERVKCGCSGIEYTWQCSNPAVEGDICILRKLPKMPAEIKALPCCLDCPYRV